MRPATSSRPASCRGRQPPPWAAPPRCPRARLRPPPRCWFCGPPAGPSPGTGPLVATGVLSGTATPGVGRATKVPARTFTAPAALLVLRGTCRTLVVDLAPLTVAPLVQELTLVPVLLAPETAPKEERRLQIA